MRILKLSPYCEPEQISSSHLSRDLEEAYINSGFEIIIIAPTPSRGISVDIRNEYRKIKYEEKYGGKLKIHRFSLFREVNNPIIRAVRYILMNIIQYYKATKMKDIDLILVGSTPPTQGVLGSLVKRKLKVPVVYSLQDIFPDSLVHTGLASKSSIFYKIGKIIETSTYKNVDVIRVISNDFKNNLLGKGVPESKIKVIYNWIDANSIRPINKENNILYNKFNLSKDLFYVVYAGNLGYAQNIEAILKAAERLLKYKDIVFLIFGKGSQEQLYKEMAYSKNLRNVRFFPLQPYNLVSEVYSLGNVSIVSCKKGIGKNAFPSKTWSILSAGTPIIAHYDNNTDLSKLINENHFGLYTETDDIESFSKAILELYENNELRELMGQNGRDFVLSRMSKEAATQEYIDLINEIVGAENV